MTEKEILMVRADMVLSEPYKMGHAYGYQKGYAACLEDIKVKHKIYDKKYREKNREKLIERHRISNKAYRDRQKAKREQEGQNAGK